MPAVAQVVRVVAEAVVTDCPVNFTCHLTPRMHLYLYALQTTLQYGYAERLGDNRGANWARGAAAVAPWPAHCACGTVPAVACLKSQVACLKSPKIIVPDCSTSASRRYVWLLRLHHRNQRRPHGVGDLSGSLPSVIPAVGLLHHAACKLHGMNTRNALTVPVAHAVAPQPNRSHPLTPAAPQVVEEYTRLQPNNTLARFLPALRNLAGKGDRFTGLDGFDEAVRLLGGDPGKCPAWGWQWDGACTPLLTRVCCWNLCTLAADGTLPWPALLQASLLRSGRSVTRSGSCRRASVVPAGAGMLQLPSSLCCPLPSSASVLTAATCSHASPVQEYHLPAMQWCRRVHCRHALTKAQLHDALVNVRGAGMLLAGGGLLTCCAAVTASRLGSVCLPLCLTGPPRRVPLTPCSTARAWATSSRWITSSWPPQRP